MKNRPFNWKNPNNILIIEPVSKGSDPTAYTAFENGADALLSLATDCKDNWREEEQSTSIKIPARTIAYVIHIPMDGIDKPLVSC